MVPSVVRSDAARRAVLERTLAYLLALQQAEAGNLPTSTGKRGDRLVQFCHGAPGAVLLWCRAWAVLRDDAALGRQLGRHWSISRAPSSAGVDGGCFGDAGRSSGFLTGTISLVRTPLVAVAAERAGPPAASFFACSCALVGAWRCSIAVGQVGAGL